MRVDTVYERFLIAYFQTSEKYETIFFLRSICENHNKFSRFTEKKKSMYSTKTPVKKCYRQAYMKQ